MNAQTALRQEFGLKQLEPTSKSEIPLFDRIQRDLLEFRVELKLACGDPVEELQLLDAAEQILSNLRFKIFLLIRNSSLEPDAIDELVNLYNAVWDRARKFEQHLKVFRLMVRDISFVKMDPESNDQDPYREEGVEDLPTSF